MAKDDFRLVFARDETGRASSYAKLEKSEREDIVRIMNYIRNHQRKKVYSGDIRKDLFMARTTLLKNLYRLAGSIGIEMRANDKGYQTIVDNNGKRLIGLTQEANHRIKERMTIYKTRKPLKPPIYVFIPTS